MAFSIQKWRKSIAWGLAILTGLAALYSGLWFVIASQLEGGLSNWASSQRARGWTVEHGQVNMSGFPLKWQMDIEKPLLSRNTGMTASRQRANTGSATPPQKYRNPPNSKWARDTVN